MAHVTAPHVRALSPGELDEDSLWLPSAAARASGPGVATSRPAAAADRLLAPEHLLAADRLLVPDHPFLQIGTWRAFVAWDPRSRVRVVASLDPRQHADGAQVGAIGFVAIEGERAAGTLSAALDGAQAWLAAHGAAVVRCPVQFSTWYGHRLMADGSPEQGGAPLFAMESPEVRGLATALAADGFSVAHTAGSYVVDVERWVAGARRGEEAMRAARMRDRPLRMERLDAELRDIHAISLASFTRSWGFSPIDFAEFASIYRPLVRLVDPDLVRILETAEGRPVGYVFALPDPGPEGSTGGRRFVAKSAAVLPKVRRWAPGAGTGLAVAVHRVAAARGYTTAVHAYTADGAYSQRVSAAWGKRIRSYATYEKVLA